MNLNAATWQGAFGLTPEWTRRVNDNDLAQRQRSSDAIQDATRIEYQRLLDANEHPGVLAMPSTEQINKIGVAIDSCTRTLSASQHASFEQLDRVPAPEQHLNTLVEIMLRQLLSDAQQVTILSGCPAYSTCIAPPSFRMWLDSSGIIQFRAAMLTVHTKPRGEGNAVRTAVYEEDNPAAYSIPIPGRIPERIIRGEAVPLRFDRIVLPRFVRDATELTNFVAPPADRIAWTARPGNYPGS